MEEKKEDLRVRKTKRNIKLALSQLLQAKPLNKITVTEIAKTAEINKGTFYLHYTDIDDLYSEFIHDVISNIISQIDFLSDFFYDPENFVRKMLDQPKKNTGQHEFLYELTRHNRSVPRIFAKTFREHLYAAGPLAPSLENDMKLEFLINSCTLLALEYGQTHPETVVSVMSKQIRNAFSH